MSRPEKKLDWCIRHGGIDLISGRLGILNRENQILMKREPSERDRQRLKRDEKAIRSLFDSLPRGNEIQSPQEYHRNIAKQESEKDATSTLKCAKIYDRQYQTDAVERIFEEWKSVRSTLVVMSTGLGKCLGKGTPILMFDGTIKSVELVRVGDELMGPDSQKRVVKSIARGREMMYRVNQVKSDSYVVNESHILSLKWTNEDRERSGRKGGEIINVSVRDYLNWGKTAKHVAKGWKSSVNWEHKNVMLDPYFLGLWLGDGSKRNSAITTIDPEVIEYINKIADEYGMTVRKSDSNGTRCPTYYLVGKNANNRILARLQAMNLIENKHIPHEYKANSREVRLRLIAGLIDTDGSLEGGCYCITQKSYTLANDIVFVARSLGMRATIRRVKKTCVNNGVVGSYYSVIISGDIDSIPVRIEKKKAEKRKCKKNVLRHGIRLEQIGVDDYYGFEIDGPDRLFLLGDFTVTHNTIVAVRVCERVLNGEVGPGGFLFLAHKDELIQQAYEEFRSNFPGYRVEVEKGEVRASKFADIVIGSVQSMYKPGRLNRFDPNRFAGVCIDECHHAIASNLTYTTIRKHFAKAKILGLTATPDRQDEIALGQIFDSVAYVYDISEAIADGWLVPIGQRLERAESFDLSIVSTDSTGEFNQGELNRLLREHRNLFVLAECAIKYSNLNDKRRPTLVFCASREHAIDVSNIINAQHAKFGTGAAAAVHYKLDEEERPRIISDFKAGKLQYLTNFGILTEGFDYDAVRVVVNGRPIHRNRSGFAQMAGRATRPLKDIRKALSEAKDAEERKAIIRNSAKPGAIIVDICGINHKLVLTMADILGGSYTDEIIATVKDRIAAHSGPVDVDEELKKAAIAAEKKARDEARAKLYENINVNVELRGRNVDPFNVYDAPVQRESGLYGGKQISNGQRSTLLKFGIPEKDLEGMTAGRAGRLIQMCYQRRRQGFCSYNQAKILKKYGYEINVTFKQASDIIDRLAKNRWKRPDDE